MFGDENLVKASVQDLVRLDAEHPLGGPVDRGDDPVSVYGDDARRDVAQDRFHIFPPLFQIQVRLFQPLIALFEVPRHLIEGIDEDPDLVVRNDVDLMIQIPLGDLPGRLGQILDRNGDPLGKIDDRTRSPKR